MRSVIAGGLQPVDRPPSPAPVVRPLSLAKLARRLHPAPPIDQIEAAAIGTVDAEELRQVSSNRSVEAWLARVASLKCRPEAPGLRFLLTR